MATISTRSRKALPTGDFADPSERKYPIHDKAHADNAAARIEQQKGSMSPAKYKAIKARITAAQKRFGEKPKKKQLHVRADLAEGGSLHIRHMSDGAEMLQLDGVLLSDAGEDGKPVWIQLAKPGSFRGHPSGPFALDAKLFEEIVRNFKATENQRVPVDYEHASEAPATEGTIPVNGAPAQGWIVDMKIQGGSLWGLVEWLPQAREQIRAGQYKFFSPAIRFNSRDRVTGQPIGARMTSGALTNNPFLDGMRPLAAKDAEASATLKAALAHAPHEYMPAVKRALNLHELASPMECSDHLEKLRDMVAASDGDVGMTSDGIDLGKYAHPMRDLVGAKPGDTWDDVFDAVQSLIDAAIEKHELEYHADEAPMSDSETEESEPEAQETNMSDAKVAELTLELKDREAKVGKLEEENKALLDWKQKREEKDLSDRVSEAFATYKDKKQLTDDDKDAMLIVLRTSPEKFEKLYPRVHPEERHLMRQVTPPAPKTQEHVIDRESNAHGVPVGEPLSGTITRLMKDEKLSYAAAAQKARIIRAA